MQSHTPESPATPGSFAFWRAYLVTFRPYLSMLSGASGLLGLALVGDLTVWQLVAGTIAFLPAYGFGQALTDVFQTDTDALSAPYRPLPRGVIRRRDVAIVSLAGLGCSVLILTFFNPAALPVGALIVAGLVGYSWFKRRWWAGPAWNAWIVALLPLMGALCGGGSIAETLARRGVRAAMAAAFFSYTVFVLVGYFKDITADRATGYRTLPAVFGWRPATIVSMVLAAGAIATWLWAWTELGAVANFTVTLLAGSGLLGLVLAHGELLRQHDERLAYRAVAWSARSHVHLQLALAAAADVRLSLAALLGAAIFELMLPLRPDRSQI